MKLTEHAVKRWNERFSGLDIETEYLKARQRVGKKTKRKIKETCPLNAHYCNHEFNGRYMKMTKEGIIFVIAPPETIITVLKIQ